MLSRATLGRLRLEKPRVGGWEIAGWEVAEGVQAGTGQSLRTEVFKAVGAPYALTVQPLFQECHVDLRSFPR